MEKALGEGKRGKGFRVRSVAVSAGEKGGERGSKLDAVRREAAVSSLFFFEHLAKQRSSPSPPPSVVRLVALQGGTF